MAVSTSLQPSDPLPATLINEIAAGSNTTYAGVGRTDNGIAAYGVTLSGVQQTLTQHSATLQATTAAVTALQQRRQRIEDRLTALEIATAPLPPTPEAATNLTAGTITATSVALSVTPPASGPAPTGYLFRAAAAGSGNYATTLDVAIPNGSMTGLTANTAYDFIALAYNANGPGPATPPLRVNTTNPAFTPSPAWFEIPRDGNTITLNDGSSITIVAGVVMRDTGGGALALGHSSYVIVALVNASGVLYQESNAPELVNEPGGVGWWYADFAQQAIWVFTSDPRPAAPGKRNPNTIPFATNSVWNIGMGNNATWASASAPETATLRSLILDVKTDNYGQPLFFGGPTDRLVTFNCTGQGTQSNVPWSRQRRIPAGALPSGGTDRHINLIDSAFPLEMLSMWNCQCPQFGNLQNGSVMTSGLGGVLDLTKNGLVGSEYPGAEYIGTDNFFAGTITQYDMAQGVIRHMLRCAISMAQLLAPNETPGSNQNVEWPNTDVDYYHYSANYAGNLPVGTYGIPNNVNIDAIVSTVGGRMLGHCLQDYGMVWRDQGGNPPALSLYSVPELAGNPRIAEMNTAWNNTLRNYACRLTNQAATNVNGGGTRRVAPLPPVGI